MTNRITALLVVLAVGGLILPGSAAAQTTTTTQTTTETNAPNTQANPNVGNGQGGSGSLGSPTNSKLNAGPGSREQGHSWENHVNQREQNQQNRIGNGIKNGQLSAGQAAHLENRENAIEQREKADEAEHHGRLTPQEKEHFQRAQNKVSRQIYKDKHPKK